MSIFINPGSGPVADATAAAASCNMEDFIRDLTAAGHTCGALTGLPRLDGAGRFGFVLEVDGQAHEIEMPGRPLDEVRWMDDPDQNIWDFPRLYVDGSSWVWKYALSVCERDTEEDDS